MKISTQSKMISIAAGVGVFAISAPVIEAGSLLLAPAVTAGLWAYFSKKEGEAERSGQRKDSEL